MKNNIQTITIPESGQVVVVRVSEGDKYSLSFSLESATITREGSDLIITFPNGAVIILRSMEDEVDSENPATLHLVDGSVVFLTELMSRFGIQAEEGQSSSAAEGDGNIVADAEEAAPASDQQESVTERNRPDSSQGLNPFVDGSGVGQFKNDPGELISGTWALPQLGTFHWDRDTTPEIIQVNGEERGHEYGTRIVLRGSVVNESDGYAGFSIAITTTIGSGSTLVLSLGGGSATSGVQGSTVATALGVDYVQEIEYWDGSGWQSATLNTDGTFTVPVSGSNEVIEVRVPLLDDHMNEGNETIGLTVVGLVDGNGMTVTDIAPDNHSAFATIVEDNTISSGTAGLSNELDGPVVSINLLSSPVIEESTAGTHRFGINVKDCITNSDYMGQDSSGEVTQDITITFTLDGLATYGTDYTFSASTALQTLITAGKAEVSIDGNGTGILTLFGKYDANGNLRSGDGTTPFAHTNYVDLVFDAVIVSDLINEPLPENIRMTLTSVTGNEAQLGTTVAQGLIADDPLRTWGPVLTLTTESMLAVIKAESGTSDTWDTTPATTVTHNIKLDFAAPDTIRVEVQITGQTNCILFNGNNMSQADFQWGGDVQYNDGSNWHTLPPANYSFDPTTGKLLLTIPEGAEEVSFTTQVIDDMRETGEIAEAYDLALTLVGGSNADCAAVLGNGSSPVTHIDNTVTITPDTRSYGDLDPAHFDGPFVVIKADPAREGLLANGSDPAVALESSGQSLPFTLSLLNPASPHGLYGDAVENITVDLKISGSTGFQLQDLLVPDATGMVNGAITLTLYHANGTTSQIPDAISISGSGSATDITLLGVVIPIGVNKIEFNLPINDDPLGASFASSLDRPDETVTVTIVNVSGNEARVPGTNSPNTLGDSSASLIIRDDTIDNPAITTDDAGLEGVRVGLVWGDGSSGSATHVEGTTAVVKIQLYDKAGNVLTGGNNPYANYLGGGTYLPEDLVITMNFAESANQDDLGFKVSSDLRALVVAGKVTIEVDGTPYNTSNIDSLNLSSSASSTVVVTLKGGTTGFDLASDLGALGFNAHIHGDNINEYTADRNHPATEEQFGLTIASVEGNESVVHKDHKFVQGTILDAADGELYLSNVELNAATDTTPGSWNVTINLFYQDGERANPTPSNTVAQGAVSGSALKVPGEDITVWLRVTDGSMMQKGEEYEISEYEVFLSVNGLTPGFGGAPADETEYQQNNYTPEPYWITVSESGTGSSALFELEVPKEYWATTAGNDGKISFDIQQGGNIGGTDTVNVGKGGFTVQLVAPPAGTDMQGEIVRVDQDPVYADEDDGVSIKLGINATPVIHEHPVNPGDNVATYHIDFSQWRGGNELPPDDFALACGFSFDLAIRGGTATFNDNTEEKTTYATMGDFALSNGDGEIYPYNSDDLDTLRAAVQDIVDGQYATGEVTVAVRYDPAQGYVIKFFVAEGVNLKDGIDLFFVALDDGVDDDGERFSCRLSSVDTGGKVDITLATNNVGHTTIRDEVAPEDRSGYALTVSSGTGYEKLVSEMLALQDGMGNPIDGMVHVPLYAYILGSDNQFPGGSMMGGAGDSEILTLVHLVTIYNDKTGSTLSVGDPAVIDPAHNSAFHDFVVDHFIPTQNITVTLELGGGDAEAAKDFKDQTEALVPAVNGDGESPWSLVINSDGTVYFQSELTIDSINDYLEQGDIAFDLKLVESKGNESRPANSTEVASIPLSYGQDITCTNTIKDYHDGPVISSMGVGPSGKLFEPVDFDHNGSPTDPKKNTFTIQLDRATEEDMVIWLNVTEAGDTDGDDYFLGKGIFQAYYDNNDWWYKTTDNAGTTSSALLSTLGLVPPVDITEKVYFTTIIAETSSVTFDIMVKDDNKSELNDTLSFEVIAVQGGEATYINEVNGKEYVIPWSPKDSPYLFCYEKTSGNYVEVLVDEANNKFYEIGSGQLYDLTGSELWLPTPPREVTLTFADDGFGPVVSLEDFAWNIGDDAPSFKIRMEDECQEDVEVNIVVSVGGQQYSLAFTVTEGDTERDIFPQDFIDAIENAGYPAGAWPSLDDFTGIIDIRIISSPGGETIPDTDPHRVAVYGSGPAILLHDLKAENLDEGVLPAVLGGYGEFSVGMTIPAGLTLPTDFSFTISFPQSDHLLGGDTAEGYTVTLSQQDLEAIQDLSNNSTEYTITIAPDAGGIPVLTVTAQNGDTPNASMPFPSTNLDLLGGDKLPAAKSDTEIGDEEYITVSISQATGAHVDPGSSMDTMEITDKTTATIRFFMQDSEGNWLLVDNTIDEGIGLATLKAVLVLADSSGNPVDAGGMPLTLVPGTSPLAGFVEVTTQTALEFDIIHAQASSDPAKYGEDYSISLKVRIEAGESGGEFSLAITQDEFSEGAEGFTIHLEATLETVTVAGNALDQIVEHGSSGSGEYGNTDLFIVDDGSGPEISWSVDKTSVAEDGEIVIEWESRLASGRQVVAENVDMVFKLVPDTDFTIDEIRSIFFGGNEYTHGGSPYNLLDILDITSSPTEWYIKLNSSSTQGAGLPVGTGLNSLTIKLEDDNKSESAETLTITLHEIKGGETSFAAGSGPGDPKEITITDLRTGLVVGMLADTAASNEEDGIFYKIQFGAGDIPDEDAHLVLQLDADSMDYLNTGGTFTVGGVPVLIDTPGALHNYDTASGKLTVTVPSGHNGSDIVVVFPVKNTVFAEDRDFSVSLADVNGGEMSLAPNLSYSGVFAEEFGAVTGSHGGINTYSISPIGTLSDNTSGSLRFEVTGLANKSVIKELYLDGQLLVEGDDWEWFGDRVVITSDHGTMQEQYTFQIYYNENASEEDLDFSKGNIEIENAGLVGEAVVVPIADAGDGVTATVLSVSAATVEEGGAFTGTIRVAVEDTATAEDLTITLRVAPAVADFSVSGYSFNYTITAGVGTATITVPAGTVLSGGEVDLVFNATMPDNILVSLTENHVFTVTGVSGSGAYEGYVANTATQAVARIDETSPSDRDGPTVSITGGGNVVQGNDATFNLVLTNDINGPSSLAEGLNVTLTLSGEHIPATIDINGNSYTVVSNTVTYNIPVGTSLSGPFLITMGTGGIGESTKIAVTGVAGTGGSGVGTYEKLNFATDVIQADVIIAPYALPLLFNLVPDAGPMLEEAVLSSLVATENEALPDGEFDSVALAVMGHFLAEGETLNVPEGGALPTGEYDAEAFAVVGGLVAEGFSPVAEEPVQDVEPEVLADTPGEVATAAILDDTVEGGLPEDEPLAEAGVVLFDMSHTQELDVAKLVPADVAPESDFTISAEAGATPDMAGQSPEPGTVNTPFASNCVQPVDVDEQALLVAKVLVESGAV